MPRIPKLRIPCLTISMSDAVDTALTITSKGVEASKDVITAAVPVPGLGLALNVTVEILNKIQVRLHPVYVYSCIVIVDVCFRIL